MTQPAKLIVDPILNQAVFFMPDGGVKQISYFSVLCGLIHERSARTTVEAPATHTQPVTPQVARTPVTPEPIRQKRKATQQVVYTEEWPIDTDYRVKSPDADRRGASSTSTGSAMDRYRAVCTPAEWSILNDPIQLDLPWADRDDRWYKLYRKIKQRKYQRTDA